MTVQASLYPPAVTPEALNGLLPCSHGNGCPLGVDAATIAAALRAGDHSRAYLLARAPNPFASSCGHGCHAPCETACRRGAFGAPVAIASLEAYASGFSIPALLSSDEPCTSAHDARSVAGLVGRDPGIAGRAPREGAPIAIIGAGAAGLACAHDLALLGHPCTIFDAGSEPGGLLTNAIPAFRFPVAAARAECAMVLAQAVDYRGGVRIEGHRGIEELLSDSFAAVFLAIGASTPAGALLEVAPGHPQVRDAMTLLRYEVSAAGRVVVVGEGDMAIDAARVAIRQARQAGAEGDAAVDVVLTARIEHSAIAPASLGAAIQDGVRIHDGWTASRVVMEGANRIVGIEIRRDSERAAKRLPCDQVFVAPPRVPDAGAFGDTFVLDGAGFIAIDPSTMRTSLPDVWAGGACVAGHRSIAHAVADGKRAAWHIHASLRGAVVRKTLIAAWVEADHVEQAPRSSALSKRRLELPLLGAPPADPFSSHALRAYDEIVHEAARCFDCATIPFISGDDCTRCGKCVQVCPTSALSIDAAGGPPVLDQESCTRCGACADRCPEGAIAMVRAVWEERLTLEQMGSAPVSAAEAVLPDALPVLTPR